MSSDLIAYKKSSQDGRIAVYLLHKNFLEEQDGNCLPITGVIKHNKNKIEEDKIFCLVNLTYRYEHGEDTISVEGYERSIQLINSPLKSDGISGDLKPKILNYDVEYEKQVEQRRKDIIEAQNKLKELLEEEEQTEKSGYDKMRISNNHEDENKTKNGECKNKLDNEDASTKKSKYENESAEKSNDEEVNTEKINENNEVNSSNNDVSDNQDSADKSENELADKSAKEENTEEINVKNEKSSSDNDVSDKLDSANKSENQISEMENGKDENKEFKKCSDSADKSENQLTEIENEKDENKELKKCSDSADKSENQLTEIENGKDENGESQKSSDIADKSENQLTEIENEKAENEKSKKCSDSDDKSENQVSETENGKDEIKELQKSSDKKPDENNECDNKPMVIVEGQRRRSSTFHPLQNRLDEMMLLYALPVPTDDQMNALKPIQNSNNEEFDSRQKKLQEALMKKLKEEGDGSLIPFSIKIPAEAPNAAFIASDYKSKKSPVGVSYRFSVYADTAIKEVPSKSSSASFPVLKKQIGSYVAKKPIYESKRIMCEPGFIDLSLHSDSNTFFHGEGIEMTVKFENKSKKTVKFVRCDVVQHVYIPTTGSKYERVVATLESRDYCPLLPSYKYSRKFVLIPDIKYIAEDNKGITYLGSFKTSEFQLASSYIPSDNPNNLDETLGVHVSYSVNANVAFGTVLGNISIGKDIFIYEDKSLHCDRKEKLSDDIDVEVEDIA